MSINLYKYCRDPFKNHRRRIYSHLRVASEQLIAECASLSLRSGDLLHSKSPLLKDRDAHSAISCTRRCENMRRPMILERVTTVLVDMAQKTYNLEKTRALAQIRKHYLLSHANSGQLW